MRILILCRTCPKQVIQHTRFMFRVTLALSKVLQTGTNYHQHGPYALQSWFMDLQPTILRIDSLFEIIASVSVLVSEIPGG